MKTIWVEGVRDIADHGDHYYTYYYALVTSWVLCQSVRGHQAINFAGDGNVTSITAVTVPLGVMLWCYSHAVDATANRSESIASCSVVVSAAVLWCWASADRCVVCDWSAQQHSAGHVSQTREVSVRAEKPRDVRAYTRASSDQRRPELSAFVWDPKMMLPTANWTYTLQTDKYRHVTYIVESCELLMTPSLSTQLSVAPGSILTSSLVTAMKHVEM